MSLGAEFNYGFIGVLKDGTLVSGITTKRLNTKNVDFSVEGQWEINNELKNRLMEEDLRKPNLNLVSVPKKK